MAAPPELLKRVPLFSELQGKELEPLAASFKERRFDAGDTIAAEGSSGIGFFVIGEGEAAVTVHGDGARHARPRRLLRRGRADRRGPAQRLDRRQTPTSSATGLTAWEFRPFVEDNGRVAWKLLQTLAKRLRAAEQREA